MKEYKEQEKLIKEISRAESNKILDMIKTGQIPEELLNDEEFMQKLRKSNPYVDIALEQLQMEQEEAKIEEEISKLGLKEVIKDEKKLGKISKAHKEELYDIAKEYEQNGEYEIAKSIYKKVADFGKSQTNKFFEKFNKHEDNRETTYYKASYSYYMCKIKNGEELTEQEKSDLERIVENDKDKNVLDLLTPGNLSDMDVFRSYFKDVTIEEFERGILPEVSKIERNPPDYPTPSNDTKDYPEELSPKKRCEFIKENFKIKNIKIPTDEKLAGHVLFEIEDSDVIIAEKLYMLDNDGNIVPAKEFATYLIHKNAKIELDKISQSILFESKRKENERGTKLIKSVNHTENGYYDRLLKKFKDLEDRGKNIQIENDNIDLNMQTEEQPQDLDKEIETKKSENETDLKEGQVNSEDRTESNVETSEDGRIVEPESEDEITKVQEIENAEEKQQYSLDDLAEMIDLFDDEHTELETRQQEIEQKIKELLEQKQESIEQIGTERVTAKKSLQIIREQNKTLSRLEKELTEIAKIDDKNRKSRDKLIGELKSRMQKGEE